MFFEFLLPFMVFAGAALQVAGGMGFGVVAGPILIACLGPTSGIQASIILNISVATFGWIAGRSHIRYDLIRPMLPGLVLGMLIGLAATLLTPEWLIQLALCISLGWICLLPQTANQSAKKETFKFSITSGVMGGALAIPGPAAAVYLRGVIASSLAVRSSMMPLLTFAYVFTGIVLFSTQGITESTLSTTMSAGPYAVAGILAGVFFANKVSESLLKRLTQTILLATFASLLFVTVRDISLML